MEEEYYADRIKLRYLIRDHPEWKQGDFVRETRRSVEWVKKWRKRFRETDPDNEAVLRGDSRARKIPPPSIPLKVVERILEIRDHPPDDLQRVPGPLPILYYLNKDPFYGAFPEVLPRSTRTVWRILKANGRIAAPKPCQHEPLERAEPMAEWQLDYKDCSTVPADPEGKQQHVVEALNIVDAGTSILVKAVVREDYNAESALKAVAEVLATQGMPQILTFDRDPRWVGSTSNRDFPSPFVRFCYCIGIQPNICPPKQPDKNPFVERYNGSYKRECLDHEHPTTLGATQEATTKYEYHYNYQRPHQGMSCQNQPPRVAFPNLPDLPRLPEQVDPDAWLKAIDGEAYVRKVRPDGAVVVDKHYYYIQQQLKGKYVVLRIDAAQHQFKVYHDNHLLKAIPIKGLYGKTLPFEDYLERMGEESRVDWRRTQAQRVLNRRRAMYSMN